MWNLLYVIAGAVIGLSIAACCKTAAAADAPTSRCEDCYHCKKMPPEAARIFDADCRNCAVGRGDDYDFREIDGLKVSVVRADCFCNEFVPKECEGGRYE